MIIQFILMKKNDPWNIITGQLEAKEIQGKMEMLGKKMDDLKLEVFEVTKGKYETFFPQKFQTTAALKENVDKVLGDFTEAKEKIESEVSEVFPPIIVWLDPDDTLSNLLLWKNPSVNV